MRGKGEVRVGPRTIGERRVRWRLEATEVRRLKRVATKLEFERKGK